MKKFKVGNVLRLSESNDFASEAGDIIKIIGVLSQPIASCEYITIRGCKGRLGLFSITSEFASSLELLTGKEIGEAIRKWDVDHAKEEPKYREVKRPAKVGEKIKIVNAHPLPNQHYSNGDIYEVKRSNGTCWSGDVIVYGINSFIDFEEYVVLEGYKPAQKEERREAKVGDTIKIVRGNYKSCFAHVGAKGLVTKVFDNKVFAAFDPYRNGIPYYVKHSDYEIISSQKHSYTEEQIDEAKKITLRMINEVYFNGDEALFFSNADKKAYYAILIKNGTHCNFEMTSSPAESTTIIRSQVNSTFTSTAKCSNNDEPNEWIGKCVALCKALHKPIPRFIMDGD